MSNSKPSYEELIIENEKLKKLVSEKNDIDISLINSLKSLLDEDALKGLKFESTIKNISKRQKKEEKLEGNEDRFHTIINQASDAMYLCNLDGEIKMTNNYACQMLGYSTNELLNMKVVDLDVNVTDQDLQKELWNKLEFEKPKTLLTTHKHKNGLHIPVEIRYSRINYDGYTAILGFARDITKQKQIEKKLQLSELKYRNQANFLEIIAENSPFAMWIADAKGVMIKTNKALRDILNVNDEMLIGKYNVLKDKNLLVQGFMTDVEAVFNDFKNTRFSMFWTGKRIENIDLSKANERWLDVSMFAITDKTGKLMNVVCQYLDITDRKIAVEKLKESEEKHRTILETAINGFWITNKEGEFLEVNDAYCQMSGYSQDELLSMKVSDVDTLDSEVDINNRINHLLKTGADRFESKHRRKDGSIYDVEVNIQYKPFKGDEFVCFINDISDRKQAEVKLKESEIKFRSLYDNAPLSYQSLNEDGSFKDINPTWLNTMGYKRDEVIGKFYKDFLHPDWKAHFETNYPKFKKRGYVNDIQFKIRHKHGHYIDISLEGCIGYNPDGSFNQTYCAFTDITERKQAEEKLKESEIKLKKIVDTSPFPIAVVDLNDDVFHHWSKTAKTMFGHNPKSSEEWYKLAYPDPVYRKKVLERWKPLMEKANQSKTAVNTGEYNIVCKDGSIKICEIYAQYIPGNLIVTMNNVTEAKLAEKALRDSKVFNEIIINTSPDIIYIYNIVENKNVYSNNGILKILGYTKEEIQEMGNRFISQLVHSDDYKTYLRDVFPKYQLMKDNELQSHEFRMKHKNGDWYWLLSKESIFSRDTNGNPIQIFGITSDVTERKHAEEALLLNKKRYQKAQAIGHVGNWEYDIEKSEFWGSEETKRIFGFDPEVETLTPENVEKSIQDRIRVHQALIDLIEKDKKYDLVYDILTKNEGIQKTVRSIAALEKDAQGNPSKVTGVLIDITRQTKIDDALSDSKKMLELVMESIPQYIFWKDKNSIYLGCNDNFAKVAGLQSSSEIVGKSDYDLAWETNEAISYIKDDKRVIESGEGKFHIIERQKQIDGKHAWLDTNKIPMYNSSKEIIGILGTFSDITDRKNKEVEKDKIYNSIQTAVYIYDFVNDNNDYVNPEYTKLLGWTSDEINEMGTKSADLFHPDDFEKVDKHMKILKEDTEDNTHILEYRFKAKNGQWRWCLSYDTPFQRNAYGVVEKMIGSFIDITNRKLIELELVYQKEKAEESDRLKSAFLANMSHEIRTPMNGIMGFAELLKETELTVDQQKDYIDIIEESGTRMLNIINDIIDISKIEASLMKTDIQESNINDQIEYIYTFFKPEVEGKGMKLISNTTLPLEDAVIKTDREKVFAILTNLVKNAIKYSNKGSIEFGYYKKDEFLEFYVKDTGIGIPKDRIEAIFERFIQADIEDKMALQGAGLGLSITKSYVEMLGGKIWVESKEGVGSTFYFTLPYRTKNDENELLSTEILLDEDHHSIKTKVMNLKILIAEDDEISASLLKITIEKYSAQIITTTNGFEAIETCRNNPDIDLILMDVKMPGLDGYRATEQIRQFNKDVIIIAQTAYGLSGDKEKALAAGCNEYIAKPINANVLLALIQKHF